MFITYNPFQQISFSADEDASVFDEIVVTARKRAELSQSVPIPISALNEEQLEMRNIVESNRY